MSEFSLALEVSRIKHNPTQAVNPDKYGLYWDFLSISYLSHMLYLNKSGSLKRKKKHPTYEA